MTIIDALKSNGNQRFFYLLKITGLPYVFTAGRNPYEGAGAWAVPAGMTVVKGMQLPEDSLSQDLDKVTGGVASAESIALKLTDVQGIDASGVYQVLGRIFASSAFRAGAFGVLAETIPAEQATGTVKVEAAEGTPFAASGALYVGGEAIGYNGLSASGKAFEFTVTQRNLWPCHPSYPPRPRHQVIVGNSNRPENGIVVSSIPSTLVGRSAALWIGYITANGTPAADTLCRLVGNIQACEFLEGDFSWQIEIAGVMGQLTSAAIAPGLPKAKIQSDRFVFSGDHPGGEIGQAATLPLQSVQLCGTNGSGASSTSIYAIPGGTYTKEELVNTWNALNATFYTSSSAKLRVNSDGQFEFYTENWPSSSTAVALWVQKPDSVPSGSGLLAALGFGDKADLSMVQQGSGLNAPGGADTWAATADAVVMGYVPLVDDGSNVTIPLESVTGFPLVTQGDGGGAYVRFANGVVVPLSSVNTSDDTVTITYPAEKLGVIDKSAVVITSPADLLVEQVLIAKLDETFGGLQLCGSLVASSKALPPGNLNFWRDGVGLGLNAFLDETSWLSIPDPLGPRRVTLIDSATKMGELLNPICLELGVFVSWDPATAKIVVARAVTPGSASWDGTAALNESNRAQLEDRTRLRTDRTQLRAQWEIRYGFDAEKKETRATMTITDQFVVSALGVADKKESIEDKSISNQATGDEVAGLISARMELTRFPWLRLTRSANRTGCMLRPGQVVQIVDKTIPNPYTGKRGISVTDQIYGLVVRTSVRLSNGDVEIEALANTAVPAPRVWSPSALLGGASFGYDNATGVVSLLRQYTGKPTGNDGQDFEVGDAVAIVPRDTALGAARAFQRNSTITAKAADGSTVTIAAGLGAITSEAVMILSNYSASSVARQKSLAWMADEADLLIAAGVPAEQYA